MKDAKAKALKATFSMGVLMCVIKILINVINKEAVDIAQLFGVVFISCPIYFYIMYLVLKGKTRL